MARKQLGVAAFGATDTLTVTEMVRVEDSLLRPQLAAAARVQMTAPEIPNPGDLWYSSGAGNTPYVWSGKTLSDSFDGTPVLNASAAPTHFNRVQVAGPTGVVTTVSETTSGLAHRSLFSTTNWVRADGPIYSEVWVRYLAEGTVLGGLSMLVTSGGGNGYQVVMDMRRGASGTSSASMQIRSGSTVLLVGLNLGGTHPVINTWYRLVGTIVGNTITGRAYTATGLMLGEISVDDATVTSGRMGVYAYNALQHENFEARQGSWTSAQSPAATDTAAGPVELATSAETITGTDTTRAVTPAGLKAQSDALLASRVVSQSAHSPFGSEAADLDTMTTPGIFTVGIGTTNSPWAGHGLLEVIRGSNTVQRFTSVNTTVEVWVRAFQGQSVWTAWFKL
jgi:hypothetical protein